MRSSLEAGVQIGDFRIERRLGAGGMGIVYLARQYSLNRLVALKVLGTALTDQTDIARFQREAQAIARLDHPGIASVYYIGQDREICYIALEYVDGVSLREVIKRLTSIDPARQSLDDVFQATSYGSDPPELRYDGPTLAYTPEAAADEKPIVPNSLTQEAKRPISSAKFIRRCCELVRDAALALAHAHERGVVHRDIKPENLLLDGQGRIHLIDFGLARFFEDVTLTNTGALVGTPMYMSPEQVTGRIGLDHRTDIYSLGLMLYELMILRRPILAPTREGVLRQIVTKALPPVSSLNRAVPRDLESVIHKASARDPEERYQTAIEFASDIQRFIDGRRVFAIPYRYRFDTRELVAERPGGLVAVSMLLTMTAIITFVFGAVIFASSGNRFANKYPMVSWPVLAISVSYVTYSLCCFATGSALLAGRKWALILAHAIFVLAYLAIGGLSTYSTLGTRIGVAVRTVSVMCTVGVLGSPYWLAQFYLLRKKTRDWFCLAEHWRTTYTARSENTGGR